jgi:kinetochore protein Mis13/DSN1
VSIPSFFLLSYPPRPSRSPIYPLSFPHAHRAKAEESAWIEVATFYNTYRTSVLTELDKRLIVPSSSTSKGKQRATVEVESEGLREWELPEEFRGEGGVALARSVVGVGTGMGREKEIKERLEGLEFKVRIPLFIFPPSFY